MVERLRGMFAFVIVDLERREAFMARDPFGKKPLYFRAGGGDLAFASTLDVLALLVEGPMHIDPQSIADYLVLQYVPAMVAVPRRSQAAPRHIDALARR